MSCDVGGFPFIRFARISSEKSLLITSRKLSLGCIFSVEKPYSRVRLKFLELMVVYVRFVGLGGSSRMFHILST